MSFEKQFTFVASGSTVKRETTDVCGIHYRAHDSWTIYIITFRNIIIAPS
jgi:hypothetical protein